MAIFISTTYFGDGSQVAEALNQLYEAGFKNIEIGSNHAPVEVEKLNLKSDINYIIHNYFPPQDSNFVLNIASEDETTRGKSIAFIKNTIKICRSFGIKYYTVHPGFFAEAVLKSKDKKDQRNFDFAFRPKAKNRDKVLKITIGVIYDLYKFAVADNVQLLIENQGSKTSGKFTLFDSIGELDFLKKEVGERLKFNFNLAHATLAGIDLKDIKTFEHFYKNSEFFEVSEIRRIYDSHLSITSGQGQVVRLLKRYKKYFAKKNIILEYRNINIKEVKKSYNLVTKLLNPSSPPA